MRHRWLAQLLKRWFDDFEENPRTQIKIHKIMVRFWAVNFLVALCCMVLLNRFWQEVSIGYLAMISIYSNFATDYDALSAAQASLHALEAKEKAAEIKDRHETTGES